jgi:hypothetical protein
MACVSDVDCQSRWCRPDATCGALSCDDGELSGEETDFDCGGSECRPCGLFYVCSEDDDCVSQLCLEGRCAAPHCYNGTWETGEPDVDCGGTDCERCQPGQMCQTDTDCSTYCVRGTAVCAPLD